MKKQTIKKIRKTLMTTRKALIITMLVCLLLAGCTVGGSDVMASIVLAAIGALCFGIVYAIDQLLY